MARCCTRQRIATVVVLTLVLLSAACHKKPAKPVATPATVPPAVAPKPIPPPSVLDYSKLGDEYFDSGDYAAAINAYTAHLHDHPDGPQQDRLLLRMALSYAEQEGPAHDLSRAMQLLQQLVTQYPKSPYRVQANLILRQNEEINLLKDEAGKQKEDGAKQRDESTRLKAEMAKRDERIKELTKELEKLKQIDMERRPTRVPR